MQAHIYDHHGVNGPNAPTLAPRRVPTRKASIFGFVAGCVLLKPCRKKSKKKAETLEWPDVQTPDGGQSLEDELDNLVARIDENTANHRKVTFSKDMPYLGADKEFGDTDDPPGLRHSDSTDAEPNGFINVVGRDDGTSDIEVSNLRSFDLVAAVNFMDFDSRDLGKIHSSMHVRNCNSRTCDACVEGKAEGLHFVKAKKPPSIMIGGLEGSSSMTSSGGSSSADLKGGSSLMMDSGNSLSASQDY